ncbi:hypothetical protein [Methanosarcina sp. 1.H.A.2.2]|uniref:hypothetical protein n=1 Tax=Methanosarcina sp. 1.H.A.2.2 TaxID=1483601 RepID=UPI000622592E|nr:hypothetical protein [Methanosarcina sp. 1.H.A.2.2]KKH49739.1 hypothetical protein EO93_01615 [Methanosarcina sp. 1.H.A.2.2]
MGKFGKVIRYASCLTVVLIVFSILSTAALAGNGAGASNDAKNRAGVSNDAKNEKTLETLQKQELIKEKIPARNQTEYGTLEREPLREEAQERTQLKEQLKVHKNNYQNSKKNFLEIRKQLRSGNYGDEELEITREYLNSSIDYMIAHLEKVQYNRKQSNGDDTEARIDAIEDRISQLEDEKKDIGKAEDLEDFANATESVRGVWNNVKNRTAVETGQTACESLDKFVNKSEAVSLKLENEIESLNKTGVNTTELEAKLANYNALMDSARENNEAAKKIYNKENATQEELQKADNYQQSALKEIKEANQILKEIFGELEPHRSEEKNRIRTRNTVGTEFTDTETSGETNGSSGNESENSSEDGLEN